jgi:hypothetical protein
MIRFHNLKDSPETVRVPWGVSPLRENRTSRPESTSGRISGVVGCADAGFWLTQPAGPRGGSSLVAAAGGAGFLDGLFDRFTGFARALLNPANQFILLAFGIQEIAIREFGPFLFQLALGDVPVAFDFECGHNNLFYLVVCFHSPPT